MMQQVSKGVGCQEDIRKECADTIVEFGYQFQTLQKIYDEFGLYYPSECHTNYRDAWFHYRKLYNKKEDISVLNEKYGLEEHLLRAAKDAQINLLQQIGQWLEIWYHCEDMLPAQDGKQVEEALFEGMSENWVMSLWKASGNNEKIFSNACVYWYREHIQSIELNMKLQNLIHSLKNLVLDIRLGGINIFRPIDHVKYIKQSIMVYEEVCCSLQESGMIYLLSATTLIYRNLNSVKE